MGWKRKKFDKDKRGRKTIRQERRDAKTREKKRKADAAR